MKRIAVFYNSGLGNAILTLPYLTILKSQAHVEIHQIDSSEYAPTQIFKTGSTITHQHEINSKVKAIRLLTQLGRHYFDECFLDYFSSTRQNLALASQIGKKVRSNYNGSKRIYLKNIEYLTPLLQVHEVEQYAHLLNLNKAEWTQLDFKNELEMQNDFKPSGKYIVWQIAAGNGRTPYKVWPWQNWLELMALHGLSNSFEIVLVGDQNEISLSKEIQQEIPSAVNRVGTLSLKQLLGIVSSATAVLGHDSFLMHASAMLKIPGFFVFGASNSKMYGYGIYPEVPHVYAEVHLDCKPCNAYLQPNTSRVSNPLKCPDFKCLEMLNPKVASLQFNHFVIKYLR